MHRRKHCGMLTHAEIVVRTPHGYFTGTARIVMLSARKSTCLALQICKYAIPPVAMKVVKLLAEISFVVHEEFPWHSAKDARYDASPVAVVWKRGSGGWPSNVARWG